MPGYDNNVNQKKKQLLHQDEANEGDSSKHKYEFEGRSPSKQSLMKTERRLDVKEKGKGYGSIARELTFNSLSGSVNQQKGDASCSLLNDDDLEKQVSGKDFHFFYPNSIEIGQNDLWFR